MASAVGVEAVMKARGLPGTLVVMGTPAEETGGGKWIMAKNGAWKGFDACVMTHGMPNFSSTCFDHDFFSHSFEIFLFGQRAGLAWPGLV